MCNCASSQKEVHFFSVPNYVDSNRVFLMGYEQHVDGLNVCITRLTELQMFQTSQLNNIPCTVEENKKIIP